MKNRSVVAENPITRSRVRERERDKKMSIHFVCCCGFWKKNCWDCWFYLRRRKYQASWQQKTAAEFNPPEMPIMVIVKLCVENKRQATDKWTTHQPLAIHRPIQQSLLSFPRLWRVVFFFFFFFSKETGWIQFQIWRQRMRTDLADRHQLSANNKRTRCLETYDM